MDVVYKGGALLWTQASSAARILLALPLCVARLALGLAGGQLPGGSPAAGGAGCAFYEGVVTHARKRPVANAFEYAVRVALVDLDAPPAWFLKRQAADHMTADEARAFAGTDGRVLLLTNPVSAGYTQNPISVYYCYAREDGQQQQQQQQQQQRQQQQQQQQQQQRGEGQQQEGEQQQEQRCGAGAGALEVPARAPARGIAEVTNTPWGDRVRFAFRPEGDQAPKSLHVSPFMDMDNTWHLRASAPGDGLKVSVVVTHPRLGQYFDAHLIATRCSGAGAAALNEDAGWRSLVRYGFMPQRVALWIYWQAVILIAKGCPIYPKQDGAQWKGRVAEEAAGKLPGARGGSCPFEWTDTQAWPWYL